MSPPPPPPPPPQLMPPPPPPLQSLVTSEVESRKESNSEDVLLRPPPSPPPPKSRRNESDSEDVEESDSEDVEELEDNESSDFVGSEPASPLSYESCCEDVSMQELVEELFTPFTGEEIKDDEFWTRYFQQVRESEGFDIKDYPGRCLMTTVYPMKSFPGIPDNLKLLKGYAAKALEQYNEKNGTNYEVKDILKVNGENYGVFMFYITFTVTNGEKEYFQAKVVENINKSVDFPIVRPRVKEGRDI